MSQTEPVLVPSWRGSYPPERFPNVFVIGLAGLAHAGKTTIAEALLEQLAADPAAPPAHRLPYTGRMKAVVSAMVGQDVPFHQQEIKSAKLYGDGDWSVRDFIIAFGTELVRKRLSENFWVDVMANQLAGFDQPAVVVIDDVRFQNEADLANALGLTVLLRRPGVSKTFDHSSEQPEQLGISQVVDNDGQPEAVATKVLALARNHDRWLAAGTNPAAR